jgi:hypothetical protein
MKPTIPCRVAHDNHQTVPLELADQELVQSQSKGKQEKTMNPASKCYVHLSINAVDTVVYDPEGRFDSDRSDRFTTFAEARDAALSCIEVMLHEKDYDDDEHRDELELMLSVIETASSYEELEACPEYRWFLKRLVPAEVAVA